MMVVAERAGAESMEIEARMDSMVVADGAGAESIETGVGMGSMVVAESAGAERIVSEAQINSMVVAEVARAESIETEVGMDSMVVADGAGAESMEVEVGMHSYRRNEMGHLPRTSSLPTTHTLDETASSVQELQALLSKLNPPGIELVPASHSGSTICEFEAFISNLNPLAREFVPASHSATSSSVPPTTSSPEWSIWRHNCNPKVPRESRARSTQDKIRRTVFVSNIDHQATEEQLGALFSSCGQVVDCRICARSKSRFMFAFVEFTHEDGARAALNQVEIVVGNSSVRVVPSKTAILPVNPDFLPVSEDEREICTRTVYCSNINLTVSQADLKSFFEPSCGKIAQLRLLAHYYQQIAFVEFAMAESATAALNRSGAILDSLPIRVSPSKTLVRSLASPSPPFH